MMYATYIFKKWNWKRKNDSMNAHQKSFQSFDESSTACFKENDSVFFFHLPRWHRGADWNASRSDSRRPSAATRRTTTSRKATNGCAARPANRTGSIGTSRAPWRRCHPNRSWSCATRRSTAASASTSAASDTRCDVVLLLLAISLCSCSLRFATKKNKIIITHPRVARSVV